ncbi:unnamed protein product [Phytomonas sp. Hart1]|nr:unnamed protein product [Phytomonas sp. Hart1]|eukprot:CCW67856.1 unnamed protein product [Phytomonas sp. isolate Hart1]
MPLEMSQNTSKVSASALSTSATTDLRIPRSPSHSIPRQGYCDDKLFSKPSTIQLKDIGRMEESSGKAAPSPMRSFLPTINSAVPPTPSSIIFKKQADTFSFITDCSVKARRCADKELGVMLTDNTMECLSSIKK